MNTDYSSLATEIMQKNSASALQQFENLVLDYKQVQKVMQVARRDQNVLFVMNQLLAKAILKGEFLAVEETRSDDGESEKSQQMERIRIYSSILSRVYSIALNVQMPEYLLRTCINLASLCLKSIFQKSLHVKLNYFTIQQYLDVMLPGFQINENFTINFNNQIVIIEPQQKNIPQGFTKAMRVLTSTLQYITINAYFKSYYDFRRNIYTFRNSNLPILLNIAIEYLKCFFSCCEGSGWNVNNFLTVNISEALSLLDSVFMYPFTLSLHEYDHQLEPNDSITGVNGEIYFPQNFRNVLCDIKFIQSLATYYRYLISRQDGGLLSDLKKIVRIMGRMASASAYCFNKEQERRAFRSQIIQFGITLSTECKHQDAYLLNSIVDINQKILTAYSSTDFGDSKKRHFLQVCLRFAHLLVVRTKIVLSQGKKNPFNSGFQIVAACIADTNDTIDQSLVKQATQEILQKGLNRLCENDETENIMKQFGFSNPREIECFQELFGSISAPFQEASQKNLGYLAALDLSKLGRSSKTMWLHLASILLPSHQAKLQHTKLILKFYELAKQTSGIASLHYIHILVEQILYEMEQGLSTTSLWRCIQQLTNQSFTNFLMYILKKCFSNFTIADYAILDYSLQVFNGIYSKLKKHDKPQFQSFYNLVNELLQNINTTVFIKPKFFKKRVQFFSVISLIWVNSTEYSYAYQIYQLIYKQLKEEDSLLNFLKYICDLTGLLHPLDLHQPFQILAELAIRDLKIILPHFLAPTKLALAFSQPQFLKAFFRLVLSISADNSRRLTYDTHNSLPIQIHQLFYPYLCEAMKYEHPKVIVPLWYKFISLHPLGELLPLKKSLADLSAQDYPLMIREYFHNIHRCSEAEIQGLYDYIQGSVEFMCDWWEEVMARGLKPIINMRDIIEARIWTSRRQKQIFAKLLYTIGHYNPIYWAVPQNMSQSVFVNTFMEDYH